MNRLLTAAAVALTAGIFMSVSDVHADDSKTAGNGSGVNGQAPYNDSCDGVRQGAIGAVYPGLKSCLMTTSLGIAYVSFDAIGLPAQIEVYNQAEGVWNLFRTSRTRSAGKYGDRYHRTTTTFKTISDHIVDARPNVNNHWNVNIGDRVYYPLATIDVVYDMSQRYVQIQQRDENVAWPNVDSDRCEIWAKSAEGDMEAALVSHSRSGGLSTDPHAVTGWWDGIGPFPLHCGSYLTGPTSHADMRPFVDVFNRFGITKAALQSAIHDAYASVGAPDPAEDPNVSIFAGLHAVHQKRKSATDIKLTDWSFTPDQQDLINDLGKAAATALGAGATAGMATSETGPGAALAFFATASIVFDVQGFYAVHDYWQKQIQKQRDLEKQREDDRKNGKPVSENDDDGNNYGPEGNGEETSDLFAMIDMDAVNGDSPKNLDGTTDPSGGAWYAGDGSDVNIDPSNPGGDPWCPEGNCGDINGGGLGLAHHAARPVP